MKVFSLWGTPTTNPFPVSNGIQFSLHGGDICYPKGKGDWFKPPYFPAGVWRTYCSLPILPWISYRFGKRAGYIGFKVYGADSDAYKNWMNPDDVYPGSQALMPSIRLFATLD